MKSIFTFLLTFFVSVTIHAQNDRLAYCGIYGNWLNGVSLSTELELKENGTFHLKTVDYVYPQTFKSYTNQGVWIVVNKEVILNPTLQPHEPKVKIKVLRVHTCILVFFFRKGQEGRRTSRGG